MNDGKKDPVTLIFILATVIVLFSSLNCIGLSTNGEYGKSLKGRNVMYVVNYLDVASCLV